MSKKPQTPIPSFEPRNQRQLQYYRALKGQDLVFGIGPAGTGKTRVAAQYAAERMAADDTHRLIITRPTVTVDDEEIGFLPGDAGEKIGPFMVPIREELIKVAGSDRVRLWASRIELVPIAFIRGRTFEHCTIHVSEAQNLTLKQAEAIVTRVGEGATLIIEGDPSQSDLQGDCLHTLVKIANQANIPHGATVFTEADIVRSAMVRKWVQGFAAHRKAA